MKQIKIRHARTEDFQAITDIYGYHVLHGTGSFEITPPDRAEMIRRWKEVLGFGSCYLVAECEGAVIGFAYAGPHKAREGYRYCVEDSIYIAHEFCRKGIGTKLLTALIDECSMLRFTQMIGEVGDSRNIASIKLHEKLGFKHCGCLPKVGYKFDQWIDIVNLQKSLK